MKRHICFTLLLCMPCAFAFSQTRTVIDAATKQPVPGATVSVLPGDSKAISDDNGNFYLSPEADSVTISSIGYYLLKIPVTPSENIFFLTPSFNDLNEVIVSGSRNVQKRTEVPVAINVITKTAINDTKATRLDMLINKVPGVFMVDLGNEQHSMSVRQPMGYNSLFLYLEDGIPIRTVGDFNHNALIEINQASLQRIEVIKGPASSLYGSDAVGGALNFITQSPSSLLTGKIQAETGSLGYKRTDFSISNTYKKTGIYIGGYYAGQSQPVAEHNNFNKTALTFRADYAINDKVKLVTVADYINYDTDQKGGLDSLHFVHKDYTSFYRFTSRKVDAFRLRSTLSKKWNENAKTDFTLFYRNTAVRQNPFYSIADISGATDKATGDIDEDAFTSYGTIVQHSKKISSLNVKWIAGASADYSPATYSAKLINIDKNADGIYYRYQTTDSLLTRYDVGLINTAAYTQIEYTTIAGIKIVAAARYDRLDYIFDNHLPPGAYSGAPDAINHFDHFTPKLGLTYDFGNNKGIYVNYSSGFAPPNINDLYKGVKVPSLKPSSYHNYEVGGWFSFAGNKGNVEASLYTMHGKNETVSTRLTDGSYRNENAGSTSHKGIELETKYAPRKNWMFRVGGTVARHHYIDFVQRGKNFSGNQMAQSPSYLLNGEVTYKPGFLKGFRASIECESLGSYFTDPENTSKYQGFTMFNARIGYRFKNLEGWLNCINLSDKNYAVTVEKSDYGTSYRPAQLRTINAGIAYHFGKK